MKILWLILAAILIALGLATVWMPIPTGVPLLALGTIVIIGTSRSAARMVRKRRRSIQLLDKAFVFLEKRAPRQFARILKRTTPRKRSSNNSDSSKA